MTPHEGSHSSATDAIALSRRFWRLSTRLLAFPSPPATWREGLLGLFACPRAA